MNRGAEAFWIEWSGKCVWKGSSIQVENEMLGLIGRIYGAGAGEMPWSHCLGEIARLSGSRAAVVQVTGLEKRNLVQLEQVNIDAEEIEEFGEHYLPNSPRIEFGNKIPLGQIFSDYDFISESEMDKNEYYADFLAKWGFRYCAGGTFLIGPDMLGHFGIQRTQSEGHVDDEQIRLLERLLPHVKRAMEMEWQFRAIRHERDGAIDAMDRLAHGVILVAASGEVVQTNRAADSILFRQDGLRIVDGVLCAATQPDTRRLQSHIARVAKITLGEDLDERGVISIDRPHARRQPLSVSISRFPIYAGTVAGAPGYRKAGALLFVQDPETNSPVSSEILQGVYGLTPAEGRLVEALVGGTHLRAAAERFDISLETARTQLKAVFSKTGVRSQGDLIRLILSRPGLVRTL